MNFDDKKNKDQNIRGQGQQGQSGNQQGQQGGQNAQNRGDSSRGTDTDTE